MLSISKFSAAPDPAAYYLEVIANERDDYYVASGEAPGVWIGAGAPPCQPSVRQIEQSIR